MRLFLSSIIILSLLSLIGCGGSKRKNQETHAESNDSLPDTLNELLGQSGKYFSVNIPTECTAKNQTDFIYQVMYDSYLFTDSVDNTIDPKEYSDPKKLLADLRYEKDKYSFLMDSETLLKFFQEGRSENFGLDFFYAPVEGQTFYYLIISYVYPNSPADQAGLKRGDIITHLNTLAIYDLNEAFTMFSQEETLNLTITNYNEVGTRNITITKAEYSISTVLDARILTQNGKKIGYIVFQDFISQAKEELDYYFKLLKGRGIDELVLDLRYNSGGDTSVANHLATLIGGEKVYDKVFDKIYFNDKYSKYNYKEYFTNRNDNALDLKRVFIITSQFTASSSELVINSLKASDNGVEVIQVGSTTYGKPYAFLPTIFCDQALLVVNLESKNSDGIGGYIDGIEPTCNADDDLFSAFGDPMEASLNEALYYISNNKCKPANTTLTKINKPTLKAQAIPRIGSRQIISAY